MFAEIRFHKLHRATHARFEDYCRDRWALSLSRCNQIINTVQVVENITNAFPQDAELLTETCEHGLRPLSGWSQSCRWYLGTDPPPRSAAQRNDCRAGGLDDQKCNPERLAGTLRAEPVNGKNGATLTELTVRATILDAFLAGSNRVTLGIQMIAQPTMS